MIERKAGNPRARTAVRALAVLAVLAVVLPSPARAQPPRTEFTIRPANPRADDPRSAAWLVHTAEPGDVVRDAVEVENLGTVPLDLFVYPADALTTPQGAFTLEPMDAPREGVAGWVRLEERRVSLDPGESTTVPVTIRVPEEATPGDHAGAVVARTVDPVRRGQVPTLLAVGARLYLRVPGELVTGLELRGIDTRVEEGRPIFTLDLENTGNTILDVTGSYRIEGLFGLESADGEIAGPLTLIPGARARPEVAHPERLMGGSYEAEFTLDYGEGQRLTEEVSFWAGIPWALIAIVLLILALATALVVRAVRARRSRDGEPSENGRRRGGTVEGHPAGRRAGRGARR